MKKRITIYVIAVAIISVGFVSCVNECENTAKYLSKEDAVIVAAEYLVLDDNQYKLLLNEEEALKLNISGLCFKEMVSEISKTNIFILETLNTPDADIELMDPANVTFTDPNSIKTRTEPGNAPYGNLSMNGMEETQTSLFWLPREYNGFNIYLRGVAMTPIYVITTSFLADYSQTKVGAGGFFSGKVGVKASNCSGRIKCQTSDSNGATGTYTACSM